MYRNVIDCQIVKSSLNLHGFRMFMLTLLEFTEMFGVWAGGAEGRGAGYRGAEGSYLPTPPGSAGIGSSDFPKGERVSCEP